VTTLTRRRSPVRVCFVIDQLNRAGTESQLLALIRTLDRRRVEPFLCLLDGADPVSRELEPERCPVLRLGLKGLARPRAVAAAARLRSFWRRNRIDIVQTYFLDSSYFSIPLARLCGVKTVIRVRNNAGYWLTRKHRLLGRLVGKLAHRTMTNSEAGRQSVVDAERVPPQKVVVLENGVDLARFERHPPPNTNGAVVRVGVVANLRPVKNIDGLIRVARELCRNHLRLEFEVAGEGEQRAELEELIAACGLRERFRLLGSVADVPAFLARQDIAVLPSHSEGMSNALLEYMASGRCIVATDVGGNGRLVTHEEQGLLVPPGDEAALGRAIERVLSDPALSSQLGQNARRRAEEEFSRAAMCRRFEDFYLSLCARNGSSRSNN